jgi:hypothetical protein
MLGRTRARYLGRPQGKSSRRLGGTHAAWAAGVVLLASASNCGFPEYAFQAGGGAAGGAGAAGGGGASSQGGAGSSGVGPGGSAGSHDDAGAPDAGSAGSGEAGQAGSAGGPVCPFLDPVSYPEHCFDTKQADGESAVDCGGGSCPACSGSQTCVKNGDCASGKCAVGNTCAPAISLAYMSIDSNAFTLTPRFKITLTYLDTLSTPLSGLRLRYYFNHNGVTEPVITLDTQSLLNGSDIANKTSWLISRFPLGPADHSNRKTDSYLEISFSSTATLSAGNKLELTQQIVPGSSDVIFDQTSHYSFLNGSAPNEAVTVYRGSQRVWGVEPPMYLFPECAFVKGVNLGGGSAQVIGGELISQEGDQELAFNGGMTYTNAAAKALPAADAATTALLTTAHTFTSVDTGSWSVPNGKYWAYAWLTSAGGTDVGTLSIQDNPFDKFTGVQKPAGAGWALVGPYPIDVTNQTLTLSSSGTVNVAGLKLYQVDQ